MSLHMNPIIAKVDTMQYKSRSMQKPNKPNIISCGANMLVMQKKKNNFYEILSLDSENAGFDEIKKAYRSMALQYHPDVCPPSAREESTRLFVELQKAYETLSDPIARKMYDYELGLTNSMGYGVGGLCLEERRSSFPKEVWERQLYGLKQRSHVRMERKKNHYV